MICHNCRATVDNDLVFCTECGARLYEPNDSSAPTVAMNDSVVTQTSKTEARNSSPFKWIALILALIALPASLGLAYLLYQNRTSPRTTAVKEPALTNRKAINAPSKNTNSASSSKNSGVAENSNSESENVNRNNQNVDANETKAETIFDDQIEIASGEHIAYPFTVNGDARISGAIQILRGEKIQGYVFTQENYDEHFPDANYKVFSFDENNLSVEQHLVKGDYVLVFFAETAPAVVKGKIEIAPNE